VLDVFVTVKRDGKQAQEPISIDHQKSKLPQEWIY